MYAERQLASAGYMTPVAMAPTSNEQRRRRFAEMKHIATGQACADTDIPNNPSHPERKTGFETQRSLSYPIPTLAAPARGTAGAASGNPAASRN